MPYEFKSRVRILYTNLYISDPAFCAIEPYLRKKKCMITQISVVIFVKEQKQELEE